MEAIANRIFRPAPVVHPLVSVAGLRIAAGNCLLAFSFFIAMIPAGRALSWSLAGVANMMWLSGAGVMGIFSFVRTPPRSTMVNVWTLSATAGMLIVPCLMRPIGQSSGSLAVGGLLFELFGIALTQIARIYMGRSFGVLPANRGLVSKGPFSFVRHPIYIGWLVLSIGYAMSYPSARNVLLIVITLPFMFWRIEQEERHMREDPEYCDYQRQVRFRLLPGVI